MTRPAALQRSLGKGGLTIEPRPFVVMAVDAMVDLGAVKAR